jgi:hypothetical protein
MAARIIIHWLITAILFLLGVWAITLNFYYWLYLGFTKREHHSPVPFVGGLFCSLSLYYSPAAVGHPWALLPLILDPGCVYLIGVFIYSAIVTKGFKREAP